MNFFEAIGVVTIGTIGTFLLFAIYKIIWFKVNGYSYHKKWGWEKTKKE